MKKNENLELVQKDDKLQGGFMSLNTEKLSKIKGGLLGTNDTCNNRNACNSTNSQCTNTGSCSSSTNTVSCTNGAPR